MNFYQPVFMQQAFFAGFRRHAAVIAALTALSGAAPWTSEPVQADAKGHGKSGIEFKFLGRHQTGIFDAALCANG